MAFELHPRLAQDCVAIGDWPLCRLLLMNDAHYPWCILVPRRENIREIHHLSPPDRALLLEESCRLAELMERLFRPVKMNVAALGNVVPQLHVHHIARFESDPAWPGPVWGKVPVRPYEPADLQVRLQCLRDGMAAA